MEQRREWDDAPVAQRDAEQPGELPQLARQVSQAQDAAQQLVQRRLELEFSARRERGLARVQLAFQRRPLEPELKAARRAEAVLAWRVQHWALRLREPGWDAT
jgi:hypothetical protein